MSPHQAKKSLGQHFLKSQAIIKKMVSAGEVSEKDIIVEIGPGKGALTQALLKRANKVIAIEKDAQLMGLLSEKFATEIADGKLILVEEDALETNINKYTKNKPYKLIANIPYYITGALLRAFLAGKHQPELLVFLMQKEVADRIMARDSKESILSLSVKLYGTPLYIQKVAPKAFSPAPNVNSAILLIKDINKKHMRGAGEEETFFNLVKIGFQHKRKTLLKNLSEKFNRAELEKVFTKQKIPHNVRAEDVSFQQWLDMTKEIGGL